MKILYRFYGRVNKFNSPPKPSLVTLINADTNKVFCDAQAVSAELLKNGIDHDDCDFEVIVQEGFEGKPEVIMNKLNPKPLTLEDIKKINDEIKSHKWTF